MAVPKRTNSIGRLPYEDVTDEDGRFLHRAGEVVSFSIGSLAIGTLAAARHVTPADLAAGEPPPAAAVPGGKQVHESVL